MRLFRDNIHVKIKTFATNSNIDDFAFKFGKLVFRSRIRRHRTGLLGRLLGLTVIAVVAEHEIRLVGVSDSLSDFATRSETGHGINPLFSPMVMLRTPHLVYSESDDGNTRSTKRNEL